jgi:hypothetical protein
MNMPLTRKLPRIRRFAALRWLSKDQRDFPTLGRLTAWWSRKARRTTDPAMLEDRSHDSHLPALSRIVGMRREDAVLHVEVLARYAALDGRPLVLAQDVGDAASGAATSDRLPDPGAEEQTWTLTLLLN